MESACVGAYRSMHARGRHGPRSKSRQVQFSKSTLFARFRSRQLGRRVTLGRVNTSNAGVSSSSATVLALQSNDLNNRTTSAFMSQSDNAPNEREYQGHQRRTMYDFRSSCIDGFGGIATMLRKSNVAARLSVAQALSNCEAQHVVSINCSNVSLCHSLVILTISL